MHWRTLSFFPLVLWALYSVFASLASNAQGEKLTMIFEAAAMVVIAIVAFSIANPGELQQATGLSMVYATIMGLCSAGGLLIQLYAFRVAPQSQQGSVVMITCMFPALAVAIFHFMAKLGLPGGATATPRQWAGVVLAVIALYLISK